MQAVAAVAVGSILAVNLHLSELFLLQLASALTVNVAAVCKVVVNTSIPSTHKHVDLRVEEERTVLVSISQYTVFVNY